MQKIYKTAKNLLIRYLRFSYTSRLVCVMLFVAEGFIFNLLGALIYDSDWLSLHSILSMTVAMVAVGFFSFELFKKGQITLPKEGNTL